MSSRKPASPPSRTRPRPVPRWLMSADELDSIARRRCLLVLSVLSGEKPVTEAIAEMGISRGMYYQLETKALQAMTRVLTPGAEIEGGDGTLVSRLKELEEKLKKAEQEKRRSDRMLLLTKKLFGSGPVKTKGGRPPGSRNGIRRSGPRRSKSTSTDPSSTPTSPPESTAPSTPTKDGAAGPSDGTAS